MKTKSKHTRRIRLSLGIFIGLLVLSGITAFPLKTEAVFLLQNNDAFPAFIQSWVANIGVTILTTAPPMLYGTDWLAFAHLVIALFFIPVYLRPVQYKFNMVAGMVACAGVWPLAFICGPIRDIPFFHQLIDCSFGLVGFAVLYFIYQNIQQLEKLQHEQR